MDQDEAIRRATARALKEKCNIIVESARVIRKDRHMRLGKNRSGWLVVFSLKVPIGFEPNQLAVEVYEPDGEVNIPPLL